MFYTKSATARIFGVKPSQVKEVHSKSNVVWVWIAGQRPRFVSKRTYHAHFAEYRQQGAKAPGMKVVANAGNLLKINSNDKTYTVVLREDGQVQCDCEDAHWQKEALGRYGCCKHGYKALAQFGYTTARDFAAAVERASSPLKKVA